MDRALKSINYFYCDVLKQRGSYIDTKLVEPLRARYVAYRFSKGP